MNDIRETAINIIRELPQDADWNDIIEGLYLKAKIDTALEEVQAGLSIPHEEVLAKLGLS